MSQRAQQSFFLMICICLSLVAACAPQPNKGPGSPASSAIPIRDTEAAPAIVLKGPAPSEGTMDGGGADFIPDPDASPEDVKMAIEESQAVVPMVLRYFEAIRFGSRSSPRVWDAVERPNLQPVMDGLLARDEKTPDIFTYFNQVDWKILEDAPCKDKFGADKAASAWPYESKQICLSVPMITKVAKKVNLVRRVTALIVHELAHKRGIESEDLAGQFEELLKKTLPEDPSNILKHRMDQLHPLVYAHSADWMLALHSDFKSLIESRETSVTSYSGQLLDVFKTDKEVLENPKFCDLVQRIQLAAFGIDSVAPETNVPLELLTGEDFESIKSLKKAATDLGSFCIKGKTPPKLYPEQVQGLVADIYSNGRRLSNSLESLPGYFKSSEVRLRTFEAQ